MADDLDVEEALDALYATPPEDFTAARNGLAKALKAAGRKEEAAGVTALRKPNRLVWALDQLALDDDPTLAPLLEAVEIVRDGGGEDLKAAVADLREAVAVAARSAAGRLDPKRPTDRPELAAALNAVVADAQGAELLASGRLLEVPAPDAFALGPSLPAPPAKKKPAPKARPKAGPKADAAPPVDQLAVRRAEKRRQEAAKADDSAQRALARAEKAAAAEGEAVQAADAERADAADALAAAEAALATAQAELDRAVAAGTAAAESQERAAAALAEAQERADATAAELDAATSDLDALT